MKKITLIIGPHDSGKTTFLQRFTEMYPDNEVAWMNRCNFNEDNPFLFGNCEPTTTILIIEDLTSVEQLELLYAGVNGIKVNKKMQRPFFIEPTIVVTSSEITLDQLPKDASFTRRFDVIVMNP